VVKKSTEKDSGVRQSAEPIFRQAIPIPGDSRMKNSFTTQWKTVIRLAWPLVIANGFWNLQLTIDRLFLAGYSTDALGAAMAVMGVFWTPLALLQQTAAYVTTFVAQYSGAGQHRMIGPSFWQSIYISIIGGLVILLFIPFSAPFFEFVNHTPEMKRLEIVYFNAICFSALPTAIVAAASGFFTGLGETRVIILINSVGLVTNAFFDYLFIFGNLGFPPLGIGGAGYATALANVCAALYALYLILNRKNEAKYHIFSGRRFDPDLLKRFVRYGLPSGMQWALEGLAFTFFLILIGRMEHGNAALSGSGIVVTVMMLSILPALGVAQAVMVLVGQHLGEERSHEAELSTWSGLQIVLFYVLPLGISFIVFPQFYLNWFYNGENPALWHQVSVIVPYLLMYVGFFTAFDGMNMIFSFALKGAGDTKFVTLVALTVPWPLMVLPTWLLQHHDGAVFWAWGAASLYIVTQALIFWRRFAGGKWKQMSVIKD